jgi:hypothetical protein
MEVERGISQNVAERAIGVVEGRSKRLSLGEKIEKMPRQLTRRGAGSERPVEPRRKDRKNAMSAHTLRSGLRAACRGDSAKTADKKCDLLQKRKSRAP